MKTAINGLGAPLRAQNSVLMGGVHQTQGISRPDSIGEQRKLDHIARYCDTTTLLATYSATQSGINEGLFNPVIMHIKALFDETSAVLVLLKDGESYKLSTSWRDPGFVVDAGALALNARGSILHAAAEGRDISKGIVYVPDLKGQEISLSTRIDRIESGGQFIHDVFATATSLQNNFKPNVNLAPLRGQQTRSIAAVPLLSIDRRRTLGAIIVLSDQPKFLDVQDMRPLRILADNTALALREIQEMERQQEPEEASVLRSALETVFGHVVESARTLIL